MATAYDDTLTLDAPALYARLDDASGTSAAAIVGTAGTYVGSPTLNTEAGPLSGETASFPSFNGSSQYATFSQGIGADFEQGITVDFWVKSSQSSGRMDVLGTLDDGTSAALVVSLNRVVNGSVYLFTRDSSGQRAGYADANVTDGNWHHVVCTQLRGSIRIFVDGVEQSFVSNGPLGTPDSFDDFQYPMFVGAANNRGTPINHFSGSLAYVAIYPWQLSLDAAKRRHGELGVRNASPVAGSAVKISPDDSFTRWSAKVTPSRTGRHAVALVADVSDDAAAVDITFGSTTKTLTLNSDNLFNLAGLTNMCNGWCFDGVAGQEVTVTVETTGSVYAELAGLAVWGPDEAGVVLEQGSATHCYPTAIDADTYIAAEVFTGQRYVIDGQQSLAVFDPIAEDELERYHHGAALLQLADGRYCAVQVGHNRPYLYWAVSPTLAGLASATVRRVDASASLTYCHALDDGSGGIEVLTREGDNDGELAVYRVADVDVESATADVLVQGSRPYPRGFYDLGGGDRLVMGQLRPVATGSWEDHLALVYDASENRWESLDGTTATSGTALGTSGTPRFASTTGLVLHAATATNEYIMDRPHAERTGDDIRIAYPFGEKASANGDYGTTDLKWLGYDGTTKTVSELGSVQGSNSHRLSAAIAKSGDDLYVAITDRGTRAPTDEFGEATPIYYDWGGGSLRNLRVETPFGGSPTFTDLGVVAPDDDFPAGWLSLVPGTTTALYQRGVEEIHPTMRRALYATLSTSTSYFPAFTRATLSADKSELYLDFSETVTQVDGQDHTDLVFSAGSATGVTFSGSRATVAVSGVSVGATVTVPAGWVEDGAGNVNVETSLTVMSASSGDGRLGGLHNVTHSASFDSSFDAAYAAAG